MTPRAIRHYERLGLVGAARRSDSNYRLFDSDSAARVQFISRCRSLGFSLSEITDLLRIVDDPDRTCAQIADLARQHLDIIDDKMLSLSDMRRTLQGSLSRCTGDTAPDCAMLELLHDTV